MKKLITIAGIFIALLFANPVSALNINVQVNINTQPAWGPVGYDYVEYYYIPAIDCYYNVNLGLFYYWDRGYWVSARYLPTRYHHYDLYGMYKVVINEPNPWQYNARHRRAYAPYIGSHKQVIILNSKDNRYKTSRNNRVEWRSSTTSTPRTGATTSSRVSSNTNSASRNNSAVSSSNRTNTNSSTKANSSTSTQSSRTTNQQTSRTAVSNTNSSRTQTSTTRDTNQPSSSSRSSTSTGSRSNR